MKSVRSAVNTLLLLLLSFTVSLLQGFLAVGEKNLNAFHLCNFSWV